jgi:hypothetical protein
MPKGGEMIHLFYGEDRLKSEADAKRVLGDEYEVIDADNLEIADLPTIFMGASLFDTDARKILIKGLGETKALFDEIEKYLDTPHEIVILENKISGTWSSLKNLKKSDKIDLKENKFEIDDSKKWLSFNIYSDALKNPEKALKTLRANEDTEDPYAMLGAWATSAIKNLKTSSTPKNRKIVKELAEIDMLMKTTTYSNNPWLLLESFIIRLKML